MILICYDGSPDSRAAVERAAELFGDRPATLLTVWEPFVQMAARSSLGPGLVPFSPDPDEIDEASSKAADQAAADGAALASGLGMTAEHKTATQVGTTGEVAASRARAFNQTGAT